MATLGPDVLSLAIVAGGEGITHLEAASALDEAWWECFEAIMGLVGAGLLANRGDYRPGPRGHMAPVYQVPGTR